MKIFLLLIFLFNFFQNNLFAGENVIDFRLAYEHEKSGTFIVYDENVGKLFVEKTPIIQISDISKAKLIIDTERPPLWLDSAVKSVGGTIPNPQIKIEITFNKYGKEKFTQITADNIGKRIAVFINNKLAMAPKIMGRIDSGKALITTSFKEDEAQELVNKINENTNRN